MPALNRYFRDQTTAGYTPRTISQALNWSCQHIEQVDARMLLQHVLQVNHAYLLTHSDELLASEQAAKFFRLVLQRVSGVPIAYLTGVREFYDLVFKVTPAVLIPRPETELLVEMALAIIPESRSCRILDLGTGSGAIGITIAKHRPEAFVTAVDLSVDAINIAKWNAQNLGIENICILEGNWFNSLAAGKSFDLIVSNPPYIAKSDPHLQQGDLRFEPDIALSADADGLSCIRHIIMAAPEYLVDGGQLLLEHGYNQSVLCRQLLAAKGFRNISSHVDLAGIERVSVGRNFI
ncbi:MAG: peptide chain release factor N(5)-glutamine methyltransferase [Burkholderiales bacterium]|nr:peptide chain release factor N(5)-glutamine methyltransferase [Nitrosomonas sp.]MCP5273595.1 peptide chain release factor N(5)-glutamine methyltransferase [Burkholderiales bacterium]